MNARVKTQIVIDADAATTFRYLSHTKYHHLWNASLQSIQPLTELTLGDSYLSVSLLLGVRTKSKNHVKKFVQDKEIEFENKTGMLQYRANYVLVATNKTTKVVCSIIVSAESKAFAFARPMLEHLARRELNTDLQALKKAVEEGLE